MADFKLLLDKQFLIKSLLLSGLFILFWSVNLPLTSLGETVAIIKLGAAEIPTLKTQSVLLRLLLFILFFISYRRNTMKYMVSGLLWIYVVFYFYLGFFIFDESFGVASDLLSRMIYLSSQLWRDLTLVLIFWVTANQFYSFKEARLYYPIVAVVAGIGGIGVSLLINSILNNVMTFTLYLTAAIILCDILYTLVNKVGNSNDREGNAGVETKAYNKFIVIPLIFVITISATIIPHLFSTLFKLEIRGMFPEVQAYSAFLGSWSYVKGLATVMLTFSSFWLLWVFKWRVVALIPPILTLLMIAIYYWSVSAGSLIPIEIPGMSNTLELPMVIIMSYLIIWGAISPTLYQATKQMAYIPLSTKTKARALGFIDFFFSGQILATSLLSFLMVYQNMEAITPNALIPIMAALGFIWFISVWILGGKIKVIENS